MVLLLCLINKLTHRSISPQEHSQNFTLLHLLVQRHSLISYSFGWLNFANRSKSRFRFLSVDPSNMLLSQTLRDLCNTMSTLKAWISAVDFSVPLILRSIFVAIFARRHSLSLMVDQQSKLHNAKFTIASYILQLGNAV